jgi:hypothetical protein
MRLWMLAALGLACVGVPGDRLARRGGSATAEEVPGERLLLGFEEDEIQNNIVPALGKYLRKLTPVEGGFDVEAGYGIFACSPNVAT